MLNFLLVAVYASGSDIMVGENAVDLVFEDATISNSDKAIIVEDIQRVLSSGGKLKLKRYDDASKGSIGMTGRISIGPEGHHWPRAFWKNNFGQYRINEKTSKKELIVPKKLIDAYREAIIFKKTHSDVFENLDAFLAKLNKGFNPEKMSLSEKKTLFWFPPGEPSWNKESYYDKNIKGLKENSFSYPSILTFKEKIFDGYCIVYCKPVVSMKNNPSSFDQVVFVFDGTSWRLGVS